MTGDSRTFEDLALRQGLITAEQLAECVRLRDKVVADGLECTTEEILLKKNLVTRQQAVAINAALGRGNRHAIEGYEILGKLGEGAVGAVYKAKQSSMDRFVAIKVLLPRGIKEKDGVERFLREARAVAKLNHPNIVSGYDAGTSNGIHYYVMELLDGESLAARLAREKTLPWRDAAAILRQMAAALDHAHQHGLIHRDIKPANILLAKNGVAKLADLGMARFAKQDDGLTQAGMVVGTPRYMSPENARGAEIDIRSDLYGLGITLYEMLAGKPPFVHADPLVVLNMHLKEPVRWAFADVPADLNAIGHRLTEKEPGRRHATPAELLDDLRAIEAGRPIKHTTAKARTVRPRSRAPIWIGAAVATALAIVIAIAAWPRPAEPPKEEVRAPVPERKPAPPADRDLAEETPLTDADRAALDAFKAVRAYEKANPDDLEEIAGQYAALPPRVAGTAYEQRVATRAAETRAALDTAVARRKVDVRAQSAAAGSHASSLDVLQRHARDFRSTDWADWIANERAQVTAAIDAKAQDLRDAARKAEASGDTRRAIELWRELAALGVPEAAGRIAAIEDAARAAESERSRKAAEETARIDGTVDKAEQLAVERRYDRIRADAPTFETEEARRRLDAELAPFEAAAELFETVRRHAATLQGQKASFEMRGGVKVAGTVEAVQPNVLLVAGRTYEVGSMTASSLAAFYRAAAGASARAEAVAAFAVLDGDLPLAEETLRRHPMSLAPRLARRLEEMRGRAEAESKRAQRERDAETLFKAAGRAKKEDQPAKYGEVVEKYPETRWAEEAKKKIDALGVDREIVLYASDLPRGACSGDFKIIDDRPAAGGKLAWTPQNGDVNPPPPGDDNHVTLKFQVQAGVAYRLWVRVKVGPEEADSKANLLYAQLAGACDKSGRELFAMDTKSALHLRAPAKPGYHWVGRDGTDPKTSEPAIYFKASGEATLRLFAGDEGVSFDQVVLSSSRFFDKPPADAIAPKPKK